MRGIDVSVVIPTHGRREMLREMLAALGEQTYPRDQLEVVVVADGSSDGTWEMLQEFRAPYRLRPVYQEPVGRPAAARNRGAREAAGSVLIFLDDDIVPTPEIVEAHAMVHRADPDAVVLAPLLPGSGKKDGWNIWDERVLTQFYREMQTGRRPPAGRRLYSGNFSVGRKQFLALGGFDETLSRSEDVELGLRLEHGGLRFYFSPRAGTPHRGYRTFDSWSLSAYLRGFNAVLLRRAGYDDVLRGLSRWRDRKPSPHRLVIGLCLGRRRTSAVMLGALRAVSGILAHLRLYTLACYGYSGIARVRYWQGVADALGGRKQFMRYARQPEWLPAVSGPTAISTNGHRPEQLARPR